MTSEVNMFNASTAYRLQHMGLKVDGHPLDFRLYPFIPEIIDERAPRTTIIKGAQLGLTVGCILRAIEDQLHLDLRGTGYFFPTDDEVQDLSKARFDPILEQYGLASKVNTAGLKQVGDGYVWFRAAGQRGGAKTKSLSKVKSFPADKIYLDEYDEMDPTRVDAARHRLDGADSRVAEEVGLSTPTIPEFGVDFDYKQSDMRAWFWRCHRCNAWNCLEEKWPDCVAEPSGGEPYYLCHKCRKPLERTEGEWVAAKPDVRHHRGYYVSQLASPTKNAGRILQDLDDAEKRGREREFYNQVLARPYAEIDDQLTDALLNACLDRDRPRARRALGPCAMGVDPGKRKLHYVVGGRVTEQDSHVYDWGYVSSFDDIGQIAKRFNVKAGVMDMGAETHAVSAFLDDHPGWWGCLYVSSKKADYDWVIKDHTVKANRTAALDASHQAIVKQRESFPAPDERWHDVIVPQFKNMARTSIEDDYTGTMTHKWVVTGGVKNDHIKHAHAYYRMALSRVGVIEQVRASMSYGQTTPANRGAMRL